MKSYENSGDVLTVTAPYDVASGAGMLVGALFLIAASAALSGAEVEGRTVGVYTIAALSTDTGSVGAKIYWDNTNKRLTTTSSANTLVGVLTAAKTSGQTTASVRLGLVA